MEERLPTYQEIEEMAPCNPEADIEDTIARSWFIIGAEWMRDKVKDILKDGLANQSSLSETKKQLQETKSELERLKNDRADNQNAG